METDWEVAQKFEESKSNRIQKLEEEVINKIAAGEVVVRPSAALKELLENSIDAGSNAINIDWREGGLHTLVIKDDGRGIKVEDYPILWERFTTSKISKYQDLAKVASFGFRGEALASISFVGKLEITSRTQDEDIAYKGFFENGVLVPGPGKSNSNPIPCAGAFGTEIIARDLFYNNKQRKKSFSKKDEFMKLIEVIIDYATHFCRINFTLKSLDSNNIAVSTNIIKKEGRSDNDIRKELIRRLHGGINEAELFEVFHENKSFDVKINAICSKSNNKTVTKKNKFVLFINNRLVKCERLKKGIDTAYHPYLPPTHYYFVYLSLELNPNSIDVNVHPTKKEVGFSNQNEISEVLSELLDAQLKQENEVIQYGEPDKVLKSSNKTEQKPTKKLNISEKKLIKKTQANIDEDTENEEPQSQTKERKLQQKETIRVDHRDSTLDHFLVHGKIDSEVVKQKVPTQNYGLHNPVTFMPGKTEADEEYVDTPQNVVNLTTVIPCTLLSVRKLIYEFENDIDEDYSKMFSEHYFVGMVTYDQVLIQYKTCLLLVNVYPLFEEFIYQQMLYYFQNYGRFKLDPPIELKSILEIGLDFPQWNYTERDHMDKEELVQVYLKKLMPMREMLEDYFKISITEDGLIKSLPLVINEIPPFIDLLPVLFVKLWADVDYSSEQNWFQQICEVFSHYYAKYLHYYYINNAVEGDQESEEETLQAIEFVLKNNLFPRFKKQLRVRSKFGVEGDKTFTTITTLENLYQVFERWE